MHEFHSVFQSSLFWLGFLAGASAAVVVVMVVVAVLGSVGDAAAAMADRRHPSRRYCAAPALDAALDTAAAGWPSDRARLSPTPNLLSPAVVAGRVAAKRERAGGGA